MIGGQIISRPFRISAKKYRGKVKLLAVTGASNVTGYLNPIHKIANLAHKYGSKILVDGAQLVPHHPVDLKPVDHPEHIDYIAFSGHKMYAPFWSWSANRT